jgi:hypothetical protein
MCARGGLSSKNGFTLHYVEHFLPARQTREQRARLRETGYAMGSNEAMANLNSVATVSRVFTKSLGGVAVVGNVWEWRRLVLARLLRSFP